jgi:6-phosphogluconolactonase
MFLTTSRLAAAQNAYHPGEQFAYVADEDSGKVSGFIVHGANGKLTPIEGSPFTTGKSGPTSVAVDPAGRFLYATNQFGGDNDVAGFSIDCETGRLRPVPGSPFTAGSGPSAVAIDPSGRFAYVANLGSNNVSAFTIDEKSGRLSPVSGSPFAAGTFPSAIAVDVLGKFVYVTNEMSNNVSGYTINSTTGALTPIAGSPFGTGYSPMSVAVDPNERFVYVANEGSNNTSGYFLDQGSGALSALYGSPFAAGGGGVNSVTVDPNGQMVFLAGYGGVFVYTISLIGPGGQLTPVSGSPFGGGAPNFVAVDYTGTFLYLANKSSNDISAYKIGGPSTLTPISGSPFTAGSGPVSIALVRPQTHPIYSATEIPEPGAGNFGAVTNISGSGINNKGEVSGTVTYNSGETFQQAFIYAGGMNNGFSFDRGSAANGINNNAQVVGTTNEFFLTGFPPGHAFIYSYSDNTELDLEPGPSGMQSDGLAINSAGDVTGFLSTGMCGGPPSPACLAPYHAFVYQGSGLVDIGTLGGTYSEGTGINDQNEIAGVSSVAGSSLNHLFLYAQGHMNDLGGVAGESFINALINNRGEIVGSATNSAGVESSFIYRGHSFEKIPLIAGSLNNKGEIAGGRTLANGSSQAFLYRESKLINLNDLVDPSLTLLTNAGGISDNGNIVASGLNGHLYVLTPK